MKLLCRLFGHRLYFDNWGIAGTSTCKRCGHKEPAIDWDRNPPPPMPKAKAPKGE